MSYIKGYEYYNNPINPYSDSCIKDNEIVNFINRIRKTSLRKVVRLYFEDKCYWGRYTLDDFKREFTEYYNDKNKTNYFCEGMDEDKEEILAKILGLKKWR
jgi:hypothetical protein